MWRKSTRSMNGGNCVEVAKGIKVRDSKNPDGVILRFDQDTWEQFTATLKRTITQRRNADVV